MDAVAARCGRRRPEIVIGRAPSVDPVFPMPIDPYDSDQAIPRHPTLIA
jgi:hypothetical protein